MRLNSYKADTNRKTVAARKNRPVKKPGAVLPPVPLSGSTNDVVQKISLRYVTLIKLSLTKFLRTSDQTSLHKIRVAVRRLRATLKLYKKSAIDRKALIRLRSKLSKITSATNAARDYQVQIETFIDHCKELKKFPENSILRARVIGSLEKHLEKSLQRVILNLKKDRDWINRSLSKEVRSCFSSDSYLQDIKPLGGTSPFIVEFRRLDRKYTKQLRSRLKSLSSLQEQERIHNSRLCTKNLRYLLEPFRKIEPRLEQKYNYLSGLQNMLGEIRDLMSLCDMLQALKLGGKSGTLVLGRQNDLYRENQIRALELWADSLRQQAKEKFKDLRSKYFRKRYRIKKIFIPTQTILSAAAKVREIESNLISAPPAKASLLQSSI